MTHDIFQEMAKRFAEQGQTIKKISSKSAILFSVHPFLESFLGWNQGTLSHFTLLDCLPLVDISEEEIVSGSKKLRSVISEAIDAMKSEEEHIQELKRKSLSITTKKNQMVWFDK
ncbi:hypothetical protein [Telmatospirillum sp.]|uniref:hypothetical protein n=1 Tax=Telmatospirillum sp. TaxID=2079197 RepID=UPI002850053C|nr:hypothetical protein [Telmatospirillum sp.]MDR3439378.1 hypothetical protein [Telmatospirillum sp.]